MYGWKRIVFKTEEAKDKWIEKHGRRYQWEEILMNNAWCIECRKLIKIY